MLHSQRRESPPLNMLLGHSLQIDRADYVDIVEDKGLIGGSAIEQKRSCILEPTARVQQDVLSREIDMHAEVIVVLQKLRNLVSEVMRIHDDVMNATCAQA